MRRWRRQDRPRARRGCDVPPRSGPRLHPACWAYDSCSTGAKNPGSISRDRESFFHFPPATRCQSFLKRLVYYYCSCWRSRVRLSTSLAISHLPKSRGFTRGRALLRTHRAHCVPHLHRSPPPPLAIRFSYLCAPFLPCGSFRSGKIRRSMPGVRNRVAAVRPP
jgi:hypothetical protein